MSIPDDLRRNFETLLRAAVENNLGLMECHDVQNGRPRYVSCAVGQDGADSVFTPLGHLAGGNPYAQYQPPDPDDPVGFLPASRSDQP